MRTIITPMGGTGSSFLAKNLPISCLRPDVVFCDRAKGDLRVDLDRYPEKITAGMIKEWSRRSGVDLDKAITVNDNLMEIFRVRKGCLCKKWVLLSGSCSTHQPFLTRNKLKAICLVRHPLHAYVSFFKHQHPNHAAHWGGFDTPAAVFYWAQLWNNIVKDFMSSGNRISRYEFWPEDSGDTLLIAKFVGRWTKDKRNWGELPKDLEDGLRELVWDNFVKIYGDNWRL